jgi:hypothetical protein
MRVEMTTVWGRQSLRRRGRRLFLGSHARKQSTHDDDKKEQEHGFEQHPNNPFPSLRSAAPAACSWPYPRQSLYHRQELCHPQKGATPCEPWPASGPRCAVLQLFPLPTLGSPTPVWREVCFGVPFGKSRMRESPTYRAVRAKPHG